MLVNAVYFNGKWENGFDPTRTETKNFTTIDNQVVAEEFMKMQGPMLRARIKEIEADALAIPYTVNLKFKCNIHKVNDALCMH